jgi:DNA-binding winged helix-turn-helix (wHTH) protein/tetratricopeptide (TPR) repeat protein
MHYRWSDYGLDRDAGLLTRQGQQIEVSRRVFDCISHLIVNHERVVGHDELIRTLWRHDNVSNHQLAQVILAARRAIGDDGHSQRLIRTVSGLGYQWVQALSESEDPDAAHQTQAPDAPSQAQVNSAESASERPQPPPTHEATPASEPPATTIKWYRSGKLHAVAALTLTLTLTLTVVASVSWQLRKTEPAAITQPQVAATTADPLAPLWEALWKGRYEEVRNGLATLPERLADLPEARILEINLDIERGRFDRAMEKLALQQARAKNAADPVWQAKLFALEAVLSGSAGKPGAEVLAPADSAVKLLESVGKVASPGAMGEALSARGYGFMKTHQLDPAIRDLVRARDLLMKAGDKRSAANAADTLARVQMRLGRLKDALELMTEIAKYAQQAERPVQEIYARNAATKIQVELLRWSDALASSDRSMQLLKKVPGSERRTRVLQLRALVLTGQGRLREAASLIREKQASDDNRYSAIVPVTHQIASGEFEQALVTAAAATAFDKYSVNDQLNLESEEGAVLLWMIAAQRLAANGKAMPEPSPAQLDVLRRPESAIGHIARGRWLWSQGNSRDAEAEFHLALVEARLMGQLSRMLHSSEPLIEMLLQRGDTAEAEQLLAELRGYDPERTSKDYHVNLLALRVALAMNDSAGFAAAYENTQALAGERKLPTEIVEANTTGVR